MPDGFSCPTCGTHKLVITAHVVGGWRVTCSNAHEVVPDPSRVITVGTHSSPTGRHRRQEEAR